MINIQAGNEIFCENVSSPEHNYVKLWGFRTMPDGSFALIVYDADENEVLTAFSFTATGGILSPPIDSAADAAVNITSAFAGKTVFLNTLAAATAITTDTMVDPVEDGQVVTFIIDTFVAGSYTLVASNPGAGTVTMNALGEGVAVIRVGTVWRVLYLIGGATFV